MTHVLSDDELLAVYRKGFDPANGGIIASLRAVDAAVRADQAYRDAAARAPLTEVIA